MTKPGDAVPVYLAGPSITVDVDHRLGEGLRSLLRQIVTDAPRDDAVRVFTGEFLGVGFTVRVRCTIGVTFKGDRGHGDDRTFGKPSLQIVVLRVALQPG